MITAGNIIKANKVMNIISDQAEDLVQPFVNSRQYLISNAAEQHIRGIQYNYAEKLIADLQRLQRG